MKLRNLWLRRMVSYAGAHFLRRWLATLDYQYRPLGPNLDPNHPDLDRHYIYVMWHEYLLLPIGRYASPDFHVLISRSNDGQLLAETCRRLDISVIRGSTSRGGVEAIRQMLRAGRNTHLALTPDGPRGPRQRVQPGLVYLAARAGLPVVPVGFGLDRPWRLGSWDRFALPRPWGRARCITGEPIHVPPDANRDELELHRRQVEESLTNVTDLAERWAETGCCPNLVKPDAPLRPRRAAHTVPSE